MREARKALYLVMNKEKQNDKTVKLEGKKLFINGLEYKTEQEQKQQDLKMQQNKGSRTASLSSYLECKRAL